VRLAAAAALRRRPPAHPLTAAAAPHHAPRSDKERARGDREVWTTSGNAVGVIEQDVGMAVKFVYDHVFAEGVDNREVYKTVASPVVRTAMDGINGTVFAYGVTSSGKTHTMMGDEEHAGIVPHAVAEVYRLAAKLSRKEFSLRISMLEIYNEVVNDLLDPAGTNLRLREDARRGVYVENAREERLTSADHALLVVARGNEARKTSATAYNEGSSRSHTVIRLTIEAADRPEYAVEGEALGRTLSYLTLVDLAGSESARAEVNRSQRVEGSFINKSLLTLGTVIHKLSEGGAAHIPFRDSKLTRILSNSLTGNAARMAVVCTCTPASAQAEETHNTLKFASRAKKIALEAKRNEILDQGALVARYQQEIALLRKQLDIVRRDGGGGGEGGGGGGGGALTAAEVMMLPEVRTLREKVEEEHAALVATERARAREEDRAARLLRCVLAGAAALSHAERRLRTPAAYAPPDGADAAPMTARSWGPDAEVAAAVALVRSAGEIIPGEFALSICARRRAQQAEGVEVHVLRRQVVALAEELRERDGALRRLATAGEEPEGDVTLQVMLAEREYMQSRAEELDARNGALALALERLRRAFAAARGVEPSAVDLEALVRGEAGGLDAGGALGAAPLSAEELEAAARPLRRGYDHVLADKVLKMEEKVGLAIEALRRKEEKIASQREVLRTITGLEAQVQTQLGDMAAENGNLRAELERVEARNERLQGHMLDKLSNDDLNELIGGLTQAVERVRLTVQLRRIAVRAEGRAPAVGDGEFAIVGAAARAAGARMSMNEMKAALDDLRAYGARRAAAAAASTTADGGGGRGGSDAGSVAGD
jgi:hypothetical protein